MQLLHAAQSWSCANKGNEDVVELANNLRDAGYKIIICTARHAGADSHCSCHLQHEVLMVLFEHEEIILDCKFKEQFKIGNHTPQYQQVHGCLPEVFVGSPERLGALTELLCSEMALTFQERGTRCPPWRQPHTILSKWLPAKPVDTYICKDVAEQVQIRKSCNQYLNDSGEHTGLGLDASSLFCQDRDFWQQPRTRTVKMRGQSWKQRHAV